MISGRSFIAAAATLVVAATAIVGCSEKEEDARAVVLLAAEEARSVGADENAKLLDDGEISESEYLLAADRYQTCMRDNGIELTGPVFSPVDNLTLEWGFPEDVTSTPESAVEQEHCYYAFRPVISAYRQTHQAVMDLPLREAVNKCMDKKGVKVDEGASEVRDFTGDLGGDGNRFQVAEQCIIKQAQQLYPDLPAVTVAL